MSGDVTVVMPVHNGATTLRESLSSLFWQDETGLVDRVVVIDDGSRDGSAAIVSELAREAPFRVALVPRSPPHGLARSYNQGIRMATTPYVVLMHQDVVLREPAALRRALEPLRHGAAVSFPSVHHPRTAWEGYPFWQRCMFSRQVELARPMLAGKFDALDRAALLSLGLFDEERFHTAGEDSDLIERLERARLRVEHSGVVVDHIHSRSPSFGLGDWLRKEAQIAEAHGAVLRLHGPHRHARDFLLGYFRPLLVLALAVPRVRRLAAALIVLYSAAYTSRAAMSERHDPRVALLPLVNVAMLGIATAFTIRGFVAGRQRLR